jgi:hypothetical protein
MQRGLSLQKKIAAKMERAAPTIVVL